MNSSAKDMVFLLTNDSTLSYEEGVDLFPYRIPATPQNVISVLDRAGDPGMLQYNKARSAYFYTGIAVYVRNIDYAIGYDIARTINEFLHGQAHLVIGDTYYSLIKAIGEPRLLHYDQNDRAVFVINFNIQRRYDN